MFRDWGSNKSCNLYADSSAALAIAKRKGAGKLRHINVSALWIQDVQDRDGATYMKVLGTANPADLMTKYLTREKIDGAIDKMSQVIQEGRANSSLDIQGKLNVMKSGEARGEKVETDPPSRTAWDARVSRCAEGRWVKEGNKVVRVHSRPRNRLFVPTVKDGSLPWQKAESLGPVRTTRGRDLTGNEFVVHDYWRASRRPRRSQPFHWTSITTFHSG